MMGSSSGGFLRIFCGLWALSHTTCTPDLVRIHWVRVDNWFWPVNKSVEWRLSVSSLDAQLMSRGVHVSLLGDQSRRMSTRRLSLRCWTQGKRIQSLYSNVILHIYNIIHSSRPREYTRRFSISYSGNHVLGSQVQFTKFVFENKIKYVTTFREQLSLEA